MVSSVCYAGGAEDSGSFGMLERFVGSVSFDMLGEFWGLFSFVMLVLVEGSVAIGMLEGIGRSVGGIEGSVAFGRMGETEGSVGLSGTVSVSMLWELVGWVLLDMLLEG